MAAPLIRLVAFGIGCLVTTVTAATYPSLDLAALGTARQSATNGSNTAKLALDNNPATIAETPDQPGAFWEVELTRAVTASRANLTAPTNPELSGVLDGSVVGFYNLRDQLIHQQQIGTISSGGVQAIFLPPGSEVRIVRIELPTGQTNGAGDHRIALAGLELLGDPSPDFGPLNLAAIATVSQSTTNGANTAALAIDGDPATSSQTTNIANGHWLLTLDRARPVKRIELINRSDGYAARLSGLTVRLLDDQSNTLATTTVTNPGTGATWGYDVPAGTADVRFLRISLENNATNGQGDFIISPGEVSIFSGVNLALGTPAYMVRLLDTLPPATHANDGNHATYSETTTRTTDGYWETDLGSARALYAVRAVALDAGDNQIRLGHATVRLFDEDHESVFSEHLSGTSAVFDVILPGPVTARYVRVGFENKERSSLTGGTEWYLRLREVQAFGRPPGETGITDFTATETHITAGQSTTLSWREEDLRELTLYPSIGSVGNRVDAQGIGTLEINPASTTEFTLVGSDHNDPTIRHLTVEVDGLPLPLRINEFCADNRLSFRDGHGEPSDWIELRNPNNSPVAAGGYGLSDDPASPMKWIIPAGRIIPAHGTLLVMASGRGDGSDSAGYPHATFSLNADGESLVLTKPDGLTTEDAILHYPPQREDLAYGRSAEGTLAYLSPTPGAFNLTEPIAGWLMAPQFSHSRGFHEQPFTLTLSHPDSTAELLYSLDGSEPSLPYSGPLSIRGSTTVRATVRRAGYHAPRTLTHTYLFRDSVLSSRLMNRTYTQGALATRLRDSLTQLPSICLSISQLPDDHNEREASIEVIMPDGSLPIQVNAGLVRTGGSWTDFDKKSYRVSFRSEYGTRDLELPLFRGFDHGIATRDRIDTLDLTAGNHDMVARGFYMANRFVEDTMLEMGSLNPHGRYVHVYVNGTYWGQYNAHERLEDSFLATYLGGPNEDYVNVRGNDNHGDNFVLGTPEPPNREPWEFVRANRSSYTAIKDRVDLPQMIDFMLMWFYGNCESEFRCAGPIEPGSGFKFWEADADGFLRTSALTLDRTANPGPGGIFGALVAEGHPDFKTLLADRIHRHFFNNGAMTPARNTARLNVRMAEIQDSLIAECARWGYRTPTNWEAAAETIRSGLFPQRTANLLSMLKNRNLYPTMDAPVFSQHGGSVPQGYPLTFNAGVGTIHYTSDGSDPRLPGGGVAPGAQSASVTQQTLVALSGQWKYWDRGSLPAANWHTAAYADSGWSGGYAPLGYGDALTTTIGYGSDSSNKYITSYFRKTFNVADPGSISGLNIGLVRDDGAVVYLNGVEIIRSNMPASGIISYTTPASSAVGGNDEVAENNFSVPANLLLPGQNLLAVEVHQIQSTSSDLHFDLSLAASSSASFTLDQNTHIKARLLHNGNWSALTDASFQVAHPLLTAGPYLFSEWSATAAAGSCPPAMHLFQTDQIDPPLATPMDTPWFLPYNLTSRSRIIGLDTDGLGFINTGTVQQTPGAGFVGAMVVALDTTDAQDIRVTWTGGTVTPNERDYGIRLQYRLGDTGNFTDVTDAGGLPVEYLRNPQAGHSQVIGPVTLPTIAESQELVELRWKYYFRSGTSGSRPQLRIDDIQITAGPVTADSLAIVSVPAAAQAGTPCQPVIVELRGLNGALATGYSGMITVSVDGYPGLLGGTVSRQTALGGAVFDDLVFPHPGVFTLTATADSLTAATAVHSTRVAGLTELVMPRFIQGASPDNSSRIPFACLLQIEGLLPNATYRYAPQFIDADDSPVDEGAGNPVLTGPTFIRCSSSPRFLADDLNLRHGEFVTDASGSHTGWVAIEPTGNRRFTPGASGRIRLLLNDGEGGEQTEIRLTANAPVQVLGFGTLAGEGSAVFGESVATPRNFIVFYEDPEGVSRPLSAAAVETTGLAPDSTWAAFYQSEVAGQAGRWGTILPNNLVAGARRIEERDFATGAVVAVFTCADGHLPTAQLGTGLQATGLRIPSATATPFARWLAAHFDLAGLDDPTYGGPAGDPDGDGLSNLLEFASGLDPQFPTHEGLPALTIELSGGAPQVVFRHRRLLGDHGLSYRIERSSGLDLWQETTGFWLPLEETQANPDGITETVTLRHPLDPGLPAGFFRLKVTEP